MKVRLFGKFIALFSVLALGACQSAVGERAKLTFEGAKKRMSAAPPENRYVLKRNLSENIKSEEEKRLFVYRYYPYGYDVVYGPNGGKY